MVDTAFVLSSDNDSSFEDIDQRRSPDGKAGPVSGHNASPQSRDDSSTEELFSATAASPKHDQSNEEGQESVLAAYLKKITTGDDALDRIFKADFSILCAHLMALFLALLDYRYSNGIAIVLSMLACVSSTTSYPVQNAILRTVASAAMLGLDIIWIFTDSKGTHHHLYALIICLTLFCAWLLCDETTKRHLAIRKKLVAAVDASKFAANDAARIAARDAAKAAAAAAVAAADAHRGIRTIELARVDGKLGIVLAEYKHVVYIAEVVRGGAADLQGALRSGDMILEINGMPLGYHDSTKVHAAELLEKAEHTVKVKVQNYPPLARCEM